MLPKLLELQFRQKDCIYCCYWVGWHWHWRLMFYKTTVIRLRSITHRIKWAFWRSEQDRRSHPAMVTCYYAIFYEIPRLKPANISLYPDSTFSKVTGRKKMIYLWELFICYWVWSVPIENDWKFTSSCAEV